MGDLDNNGGVISKHSDGVGAVGDVPGHKVIACEEVQDPVTEGAVDPSSELHRELGGHQWNAELCSDTRVRLLQVGKAMGWRLRVLSVDLGSRHGGNVEEMKM